MLNFALCKLMTIINKVMKLQRFFTATVLTLICTVTMMAQEMQMPSIPIDDQVRIGKLDNGLTYYIRHNEYPEHVANFYIAQRVGSIQEEENQRGLAHFLEHMAFNGSEHFKGNGIIDFTRTLGVEFGSDLNAYTSIDQTRPSIACATCRPSAPQQSTPAFSSSKTGQTDSCSKRRRS